MILDEIVQRFADAEFLRADGFDEAVIGFEPNELKLVYDRNRMANILIVRDGMSEDDAWEYLEYNVFSAYVGENTPLYIETEYQIEDTPLQPAYLVLAYDRQESIVGSETHREKPTKKQLKRFLSDSGATTIQCFSINENNSNDYQLVRVQK